MRRFIPIVLVVLAVAGCRTRLQDVSTITVELADKKSRIIEAIKSDQTIKVSGTATTGQFDVQVFLEKDQADVEKDMDAGKKSPKLLAQKTKTTQADVTALIPANQVAVVMITSGDGKKAVVNLKITN